MGVCGWRLRLVGLVGLELRRVVQVRRRRLEQLDLHAHHLECVIHTQPVTRCSERVRRVMLVREPACRRLPRRMLVRDPH
jgi:hypothetical protein